MVSENPEANLHLSPSFFVEYIHANKKQMDLCGDSGTDKRKEKLRTRRGPWSEEEDSTLVDYINNHGEGRWDSLARTAGLRRTGKSCRFRWLNYLRPGIQRGNFTLQEQLTIIELHFLWGNRWSKIAQSLPGRTDNEVKNYWRTRVGKQAKRLKCETNSKQFKETMRSVWMPRLVEQIGAATSGSSTTTMSTIEPSTDDVVVVVDSCSDASITSHVDDDLAASETLGAISSTPSWDDKVVQDFIEDTTTSSLHESQPLDHLGAHYGCSFYPGDDVLVFDNLWNWNDDGIFAPPSMNNYVLNY